MTTNTGQSADSKQHIVPPGKWEDRCAHLKRWIEYANFIGTEPTQGWLTLKTGWSENTVKACLRRCGKITGAN